jgi:hypothetical protein
VKRAIVMLLAACGGNVETSDAGAGVDAHEAAVDASPIDDASADVEAEAAPVVDSGACPKLAAPCGPGQMYCDENDETKIWACLFGAWEHQTCAGSLPLCVPNDGGFVCKGPVCK